MHIYRRRFFESVRLNQKSVITLTEWQHDPVVLLIRHNWTGNFWLQKLAHSILDQNKRQAMNFNNVLTFIFGFLILFFVFDERDWKKRKSWEEKDRTGLFLELSILSSHLIASNTTLSRFSHKKRKTTLDNFFDFWLRFYL